MMPTRLVIETREAVRRRPDYRGVPAAAGGGGRRGGRAGGRGLPARSRRLQGKPLEALQTLADLLAEASQEWIKALGHATQIGRAAGRAETEDFLTAIDRIAALEHRGRRRGARAGGQRRPACGGFPPVASVHRDRATSLRRRRTR